MVALLKLARSIEPPSSFIAAAADDDDVWWLMAADWQSDGANCELTSCSKLSATDEQLDPTDERCPPLAGLSECLLLLLLFASCVTSDA